MTYLFGVDSINRANVFVDERTGCPRYDRRSGTTLFEFARELYAARRTRRIDWWSAAGQYPWSRALSRTLGRFGDERSVAEVVADILGDRLSIPREYSCTLMDPRYIVRGSLLARFLTPTTRQRLKEAGVGYLDLTGNAHLVLREPALFIETTGALTDPNPRKKGASLKGPKAGAVIRALCDFGSPLGIRELANRAKVTPGYASRLVKLLAEEALLERQERGPVLSVDVARLLRRWSEHYSLTGSNRTRTYLAPRGASSCLKKLATRERRYAVTGSFGVVGLAPVAAPRLLVAFVDNVSRSAEELRLRPAETGANVILAEPFDPVVYDRTWDKDGVTYAAPSQLVADLLSSPGRGPNEAEELLRWMSENEDAWRIR